MVLGGAGVDFVPVRHDDHHLRGGVLFSNRNYVHGEVQSLFGAGLNLAYGYAVMRAKPKNELESVMHQVLGDRALVALGGEAQAELVGGDGARGVFSFPLFIEAFAGISD